MPEGDYGQEPYEWEQHDPSKDQGRCDCDVCHDAAKKMTRPKVRIAPIHASTMTIVVKSIAIGLELATSSVIE